MKKRFHIATGIVGYLTVRPIAYDGLGRRVGKAVTVRHRSLGSPSVKSTFVLEIPADCAIVASQVGDVMAR